MQIRARNDALEAQYREQGECCYYCKEKVHYSFITRDHILPVSKGYGFPNNKIFACRLCNNLKGNRSFPEFRDLLVQRSIRILGKLKTENNQIKKYLTLLRHHTKVLETVDLIIRNNGRLNIFFT